MERGHVSAARPVARASPSTARVRDVGSTDLPSRRQFVVEGEQQFWSVSSRGCALS
jgi:hypothetical protein